MSWFSDLAKGAEALLEKVDQQTASALQKEQEKAILSVPTTISLENTKDENSHREISSLSTDSKSVPGIKFISFICNKFAEYYYFLIYLFARR